VECRRRVAIPAVNGLKHCNGAQVGYVTQGVHPPLAADADADADVDADSDSLQTRGLVRTAGADVGLQRFRSAQKEGRAPGPAKSHRSVLCLGGDSCAALASRVMPYRRRLGAVNSYWKAPVTVRLPGSWPYARLDRRKAVFGEASGGAASRAAMNGCIFRDERRRERHCACLVRFGAVHACRRSGPAR
jgi:hypothetical protein